MFKKLTSIILSIFMITASAGLISAGAAEISSDSVGAVSSAGSAGALSEAGVSADEEPVYGEKTVGGVTFSYYTMPSINEDAVTVYCITGYDKELTVPYRLDDKYVVSLNAPLRALTLESITIEEGVMMLEGNVFSSMEKLKEINLPDSIFYCESLFEETAHYFDRSNWKDGVYYVSNHAMSNDMRRNIKIKEGTVSICNKFCYFNHDLQSVNFPDSLISIGDYAFCNCTKLTDVTIPGGVEYIGVAAIGVYERDSEICFLDNFSVRGAKGTLAEDFAKAYEFPFIADDSIMLPVPMISASHSPNVNGGIRLMWNSVYGAEMYRLYVKSGGKWVKICDTDKNYFTDSDVRSGESRTYTVKCITKGGKARSDYYRAGFTFTYIVPPSLVSAASVNGGVRISWKPSSGAAQYRVFYKAKNGSWKRLGETSGTSFTDTVVNSGRSYTYTVRCLSADGKAYVSGYDDKGITGTYIASPKLKSAESTTEGVKISWEPSAGAAKYRVFYKAKNGSWKRLGDTSGTSFTDTVVNSGRSYTYTVRCLSADGKAYVSGYDGKGITGTYIASPKLKRAESTTDGVKISWEPSAGAVNYRVFYKAKNGSWKRLGETSGTSFTDTVVNSGRSYTYTVRCLSADGKAYVSGYDGKGITGTYIAAPVIEKAESTDNGINLSWSKVGGAEKYRVFFLADSGWQRLGDTAETAFTDTSVKHGESRTYTVRCISSNGKAYTSAYYTEGKTAEFDRGDSL